MQQWQDFVNQSSFSDDIAPENAIIDLPHLGLIKISGDDKATFLQGQLTNDINLVTNEQSQLSAYCSPKGRMLANFRIFMRDDDLYLLIPKTRLDPILKRLSMFVMRSKVVIEDASNDLVCLGINGDIASLTLPTDNDLVTTTDGLTLVRLAGEQPRALLVCSIDNAKNVWQQAVDANTALKSSDFWSLLDIRAGLPTVFEETTEAFVPQMTNMQLINGVNFKKGCYTGQEIVARMQYLGTLKRRMFRVLIDTDVKPEPGTELFSASSKSGQGAGKIVDSSKNPQGGYEALAVVQISSAEVNDLTVGEANGPSMTFLELPYSVVQAD